MFEAGLFSAYNRETGHDGFTVFTTRSRHRPAR